MMLALAAGLLAAVTACTSDAPPSSSSPAAAPASPSPSAEQPAVTLVEAGGEFTAFTQTDDRLRRDSPLQGRLLQVQDITTGGQWPLTRAAFLSSDFAPPRHQWGPPTLYVPRFVSGVTALWFSALATRDGRPTLLTFAKSGADGWRLSSAAELLPGQTLPEIKLDTDGYATAVAPDDKTVTISPQFIGPVHASVAETGKSGVTAGLLAPGPYTTVVAEQIAKSRTDAKRRELSYDSIFSADNYPVYALRTQDGGALMQYSLSRTSTTRNVLDKTYRMIPVPAQASWLISDPTVPLSLKLTEVHQYATTVPPLTAPAAATVIAHDGALTGASGQ
uniref:DUF8094 domain-containing protein n=1 Tax=Nonomuraea gerenzanensis TaxID=93944 RepID=A0A1M4E110_9ACTN|nr:hypothetical protein BN4615_P2012 [Nonomuraea gerenzanensis]